MAKANLCLLFELIIHLWSLSVLCRGAILQEKQLFISCMFFFAPFRPQVAHAGCCVNHILQQCNKASHGEPFSITFSYGSALPAVDVNGVLLVAAAPLRAFKPYAATRPLPARHPSSARVTSTNAGSTPIRKSRGNPSAMKMNNYVALRSVLQRSISSGPNGVHVCRGSCGESAL